MIFALIVQGVGVSISVIIGIVRILAHFLLYSKTVELLFFLLVYFIFLYSKEKKCIFKNMVNHGEHDIQPSKYVSILMGIVSICLALVLGFATMGLCFIKNCFVFSNFWLTLPQTRVIILYLVIF